jgi:OOP family OmpA-OmpF porin
MSMRIAALVIAAMFLSACASLPEPKTCALIGAGAGAVGGGVGAAEHAEHHNDGHAVGIGVASVAGGALLGYAVCALLREEPEPPPQHAAPSPPPPAPEPPPPPPPPAPDPCKGRIVLRGVNFAFDQAEITGASQVTLDVVAETLNECPNVRVTVEGHTDAVGTDQYNEALSKRRADSVKGYLAGGGVAGSRIETRGYGESRPIASNDTDEGRSMNRRVELVPIN